MSQIGFIKNNINNNTTLIENNFQKKYICKFQNIPFTFENASMNTIITGATGSGKTKSIILPILEGLLKNNLPGLIIDIKNDFTNDVYKLAKLYNKEKDIIEIGTYNTANNINLLNGLKKEEVISLLYEVITNYLDNNNKDNYWLLQGFSLLEDFINIYYYIYEELKDQEEYKHLIEKPSLYILIECLMNTKKSLKIFDLFKKLYKNTYIYQDIKNKIEQYKFHILNEENNSEDDMKSSQLSWTRGQIILLLKKFTEDFYINKFSNIDNTDFTLDFSDLLYKKNKIIILRFGLLEGEISNIISSFIRKKMINDIVKYNSNILEKDRKECFILMDEFQNIISLKGIYNDNNWFDKSRSFKCYQFIATQGISSLYSKTNNLYEIETLINNCRNMFFLNSNDQASEKILQNILEKKDFENYNGKKTLLNLKKGECIYSFYNLKDLKIYNYLLNTSLDTYKKIENV